MSHHHSLRMLLLELHDGFHGELLMNMAAAVPEKHLATGNAVDVIAEIIVGTEDNLLVLRERSHHLLRIA